uniref:Uncharacterized protein n=1 Tax=Arundo donax TaxID=35708 RepID=A0A0A8ZR84_ARUDO
MRDPDAARAQGAARAVFGRRSLNPAELRGASRGASHSRRYGLLRGSSGEDGGEARRRR